MSDTKGITRRHNADEAIETLRGKVATKQRLVAKAEAANEEARDNDSVYVDNVKNEVWVNVPTNRLSFHPVSVALTEMGYELVNYVPGRELVFKYKA